MDSNDSIGRSHASYDSGVAEKTIKNICANGARGFTLSIIGILAAVLECGVEDLIDPGKVRAKGA